MVVYLGMLKLNKKTEYGLMAILHMDASANAGLVTAKEISERYNIPGELLGKVLQKLARKEVIESVHGARGGYRLARVLEDLTLGDVLEALEGPVQLARCQDDANACDQYCSCNIREPVIRIQAQLEKFMHNIKLSAFRRSAHMNEVLVEVK